MEAGEEGSDGARTNKNEAVKQTRGDIEEREGGRRHAFTIKRK